MILTKEQMRLCEPYLPVIRKFGLYPNRSTWVDRATLESIAEVYDTIVDNGKHVCTSGCGSQDFIKRLSHWIDETEIDIALRSDVSYATDTIKPKRQRKPKSDKAC